MSVAGEFPPNVMAATQERHEGLMTFFFYFIFLGDGKDGHKEP